MSRRRAAEKRPILPDAKFGDPVITKFINCNTANICYTSWKQRIGNGRTLDFINTHIVNKLR